MGEKLGNPFLSKQYWSAPVNLTIFVVFIFLFCFLFLCKSPDTQGLKATSNIMWATIIFSRGRCHLLLGLKRPYECRLGYHQFEAWPVEQKALPPQFTGVSKLNAENILKALKKEAHYKLVLGQRKGFWKSKHLCNPLRT